ncbi:MAG: hypothetical protein R3F50_14835 [Gammaproteobacteria bacterium]
MYACIDLGSNSFHLLIGEWIDGRILIIERCSEKVQLGEGVPASGVISTAAFQRGMDCLRNFETLMSRHGVQRYWALGTNTFRIAANSDLFVQAAADIGLEISVISGVQEAVLIFAGVQTGLPSSPEQRLVIDIGGGSTELIVGSGKQRLITQSLPVGCVSWRDRYFSGQSGTTQALLTEALDEAGAAALSIFQSVAPGINHYEWLEAFASSGTAKMLAAICEEHGGPAGQVSLVLLQQLRELLLETVLTGAELPGLKEKRRDLLLPGYVIMEALMRALACDRLQFSAAALREGMLDFIVRNGKATHLLDPSKLPGVSYAGS